MASKRRVLAVTAALALLAGVVSLCVGAVTVPPGELLAALAGRAMLVHYEPIEREFLTAACRKLYGSGLKVPTVDTLEIERRHMERMATFPRGEDLRLPRIRQRYGLPAYGSHNALGDALATAELYLVLADRANGHTLRAMQVR